MHVLYCNQSYMHDAKVTNVVRTTDFVETALRGKDWERQAVKPAVVQQMMILELMVLCWGNNAYLPYFETANLSEVYVSIYYADFETIFSPEKRIA